MQRRETILQLAQTCFNTITRHFWPWETTDALLQGGRHRLPEPSTSNFALVRRGIKQSGFYEKQNEIICRRFDGNGFLAALFSFALGAAV